MNLQETSAFSKLNGNYTLFPWNQPDFLYTGMRKTYLFAEISYLKFECDF